MKDDTSSRRIYRPYELQSAAWSHEIPTLLTYILEEVSAGFIGGRPESEHKHNYVCANDVDRDFAVLVADILERETEAK